MAPAIVAAKVSKSYGRRLALSECSFSVPEGSVACLLGPNGAGKSTLFALATDLIRPTCGTIEIFGSPVRGRGLSNDAALVSQGQPLFAKFTVDEMLRFGRTMNAQWDEQRARQQLHDADVPPDAECGAISSGQRARVALILALARRPRLLMLDEPMASLDPVARQDLLGALMVEAADSGTTILFSTHVLAEVEDSCDYIVTMSKGSVVLEGSYEDVLQGHSLLSGPAGRDEALDGLVAMETRRDGCYQTLLARKYDGPLPMGWSAVQPSLREVLFAYLRRPGSDMAGTKQQLARDSR